MSSTTFIDNQTVIYASWLNDVNDGVYNKNFTWGVPTVANEINNWSATQNFTGDTLNFGARLTNALETAFIASYVPSATNTFYINEGSVQYYTIEASNDWIINLAFSSTQTLDSSMNVGDTATIVQITTQGATPYLLNDFQIDGISTTVLWQGGSWPLAGNASGLDVYTFSIIKTAAETFTVLASLVQYK